MKRICVFCGSRPGSNSTYIRAASELGSALAAKGLGVVYGGGCNGLMEAVASAALQGGVEVIGVMPEGLLAKEGRNDRLIRFHLVSNLAERKQMMFSLADAFIALPGGYGTLSELYDAMVEAQLTGIPKPCGLLNVFGFYDSLLEQSQTAESEGFISSEQAQMLIVESNPERLVDRILSHNKAVLETHRRGRLQ